MKNRVLKHIFFKVATNCFAALMSVCLLLIAGGVNVYHFCCADCAREGHRIFRTINCDEVHAKHHDDCCSHCATVCEHSEHYDLIFNQKHRHCDVEHFNFIDENVHDLTPQIQPIFFFVLHIFTSDTVEQVVGQYIAVRDYAPPLKFGRVLLSQISVLLI